MIDEYINYDHEKIYYKSGRYDYLTDVGLKPYSSGGWNSNNHIRRAD